MGFALHWGWLSAAIALLSWTCVVAAVEWLWWRPKRIERFLTQQGMKGTRYRFLFGDVREDLKIHKEMEGKPMSLSHDIAAYLAPPLVQKIKTHGKVCLSWAGPYASVILAEPELIKEVLSSKFSHFEKPKLNPLTDLLMRGLVSYDGDKWAKHRKILHPAFHLEKLKNMLPEFSTSCTDMINRWLELIGSKDSYEFDVLPDLQNLAADVISRAAFGSNYEQGMKIFELQNEQTILVGKSFLKGLIPGYRFLPTKENRRMWEIYKKVKTILRSVIDKKEKAIKLGNVVEDNLLGLLLQSNISFQKDGNAQKGMTIDDVIEECKLFYFAGQDTTGLLLTWTMILLGMHQDWQDQAREEVLQAFGKNSPSFEELNHLKIVNMILHEALRLYPPAIYVVRSTYKTINLKEFTLPAGVRLMMPVIFLHHDKEIWGEDAHEFHPERFANGVSKASRQQNAFFPFGGGPRICIGQNFALMEAKLAITRILQHFSFELSPSYTHAPTTIFTLKPKYGAPIILHKL